MYQSLILVFTTFISAISSSELSSDKFVNAGVDVASKPTQEIAGNDESILEWKPVMDLPKNDIEDQIIREETKEDLMEDLRDGKNRENFLTEKPETESSKDLTGQETFYPSGGIWWGFHPWGGWNHWGWGGYRPGWNYPHWGGYRPGWYNPHWGGYWGGGLGSGRWAGRK